MAYLNLRKAVFATQFHRHICGGCRVRRCAQEVVERREGCSTRSIEKRKVFCVGVVVSDQGVEHHRIQQANHLWSTGLGSSAQQCKASLKIRTSLILIFQLGRHTQRLAEIFLMQAQPLIIGVFAAVVATHQQDLLIPSHQDLRVCHLQAHHLGQRHAERFVDHAAFHRRNGRFKDVGAGSGASG